MQVENRAELESFLAGVESRAYRIALYRLRNHDDALDVVQEAMMQLARKYNARPEHEWTPLFYRILGNRIRDLQRRAGVRQALSVWPRSDDAKAGDSMASIADPRDHHPEKASALEFAVDALRAAVKALAPRQQEALLLRLVEGLDVAQTANAMGCSEGSVKTHYSRAVHTLRKRLGDHWP